MVGAAGAIGATCEIGVEDVCDTKTVEALEGSWLVVLGADASEVEGALATGVDAAGVVAAEVLAMAIGFAAACAVVPASAGDVP